MEQKQNSSKLQVALRLIDAGMSRHGAALKAGVSPSNVYRAFRQAARRKAGLCPCCGKPKKAKSK